VELKHVKNREELLNWINERVSGYKNLLEKNSESYYKLTLNGELHPKVKQEKELKDIIFHLEEMDRDIHILSRELLLTKRYDFGEENFAVLLRKVSEVENHYIFYLKKWNIYIKELQESLRLIYDID